MSAEAFSGSYSKIPTKFIIGVVSVVVAALVYFFGIRPLLQEKKTKQWKGVEYRGTEDSVDIVSGANDNIDTESQNGMIFYFGISPVLNKRKIKQWKEVNERGTYDSIDAIGSGVKDDIN